ncbi:SDR family NAD(P)-dependent oxidoreductase [Streptomyces sp. NPDC046685]|uniref:SDR family NAD(P)-dependent oxidoreductase n=1 Tax=Streptomyces sp. NPDC046685 TaxID=3157202 RepID=UPI0033CD687B
MTARGPRYRTDGSCPLQGRVAVVTGSARGLGEGLAYALSRRGARVALMGLEEERLARLAADLPGPAAHWHADVTDADALSVTAEAVRGTLGEASVVVANAGVALGGPLLDCDPRDWRRVIDVNLVGSALTARCFLPHLLRTRGYYLQVASLAALAPEPLLTAYNTWIKAHDSAVEPPSGEGVDENASKQHLYELARRLDIGGRSRMSRSELVEAIRKENRSRTREARSR